MKIFLLLLLFSTLKTTIIDAIEDSWPFKIDYILVEKNFVFMDGASNNAASDPGSRNVLFPKQLFAAPDNLVFGICKLYIAGPTNYVKFSMSYSALTDTGFIFHTNFPISQWKDTLVSYMTVYQNFGVQVHRKSLPQFSYSLANNHHSYSVPVATSSLTLDPTDSTKQFIAVYTEIIDLDLFNQTHIYTTNYTTSANSIDIRVYITQNATVRDIGLSVLIIHYPTLQSATSSFNYYFFSGAINNNVVDSVVQLVVPSNITSTLFLLAAPTTGRFGQAYNYAFTFSGPPEPTPGGFTVNFMRNRQDSLNTIQTRAFGSPPVSDSVFAYIRLERTKCSSLTHPYMMVTKQQCHSAIPSSYYSNSNKQLNPCSGCTNIFHCLDCMDTMCSTSQYLNPSNFACVACSTIHSDCQTCRNASCTKCFAASSKVPDNGICSNCNSTDYFDSTSETCKTCSSKFTDCQNCNSVQCTKCLVSSEKVAEGGVCVSCNATDYFDPVGESCASCVGIDADCTACRHDTGCTQCAASSFKVADAGVCSSCNSTHYFDTTTESCLTCYSIDADCQRCNNGLCTKCLVSSKKVAEGGVCVNCNSTDYFDTVSQGCDSCTNIDNDCQACTSILGCTKCFVSSSKVADGGICSSCNSSDYFDITTESCLACSTIDTDCQICSNGLCTKCLASSEKVAEGGICVNCNATDYFDSVAEMCDSCTTFGIDCRACTSVLGCTKCAASSSKVADAGVCSSCNSTDFFDSSPQSCVTCATVYSNCQSCNSLNCLSCFVSSKTVIMNGLCEPCIPEFYFDTTTNLCEACSNYNSECQLCDSVQCLSCKASSKTVISAGSCVPCSLGLYFNTTMLSCQSCTTFNCLECSSSTDCSICVSDEFELVNNICIVKQKLSYTLHAFSILNSQNKIQAYLHFNGDITLIQNNYTITFTLSEPHNPLLLSDILSFQLQYLHHNNTIRGIIYFSQSILSPTLKVILTSNLNYEILSDTSQQIVLQDIYTISARERQVYNQISNFVHSIAKHSGTIFTSLSLLDASTLIIRVLWRAQLGSYYLFVPVNKPKNLMLFLNTTFQLLNLDLLPFVIPNPLSNITVEIPRQDIYKQYGLDAFFLRSNIYNFIRILSLAGFYVAMRVICSFFGKSRVGAAIFRYHFVNNFYNNVASIPYYYLTSFAFSAAVALNSKFFSNQHILLNYFTSFSCLFVILALTVIHPLTLYFNRKSPTLSKKNIYLALSNQESAELLLLLYILSQVLVPVLIPLAHPLFTVSAAISLESINVYLAFQQTNLFSKSSKILRTICMSLFNLMMVAFFFTQTHPSLSSIYKQTVLGYIAIASMVVATFIDIVELFIDIVNGIWEYVRVFESLKFKTSELAAEEIGVNNVYQRGNVNMDDYEVQDLQQIHINYSSTKVPNDKLELDSSAVEFIKKEYYQNSNNNNSQKKENKTTNREKRAVTDNTKGNNMNKIKASRFSYLESKLHASQKQRVEELDEINIYYDIIKNIVLILGYFIARQAIINLVCNYQLHFQAEFQHEELTYFCKLKKYLFIKLSREQHFQYSTLNTFCFCLINVHI